MYSCPVRQTNIGDDINKKIIAPLANANQLMDTIRLNTELAPKPPECLEYLVVHEMAHLIERHYNDRFGGLLSGCLPHWRQVRQVLNGAPLSHADWRY